MGFVNIVINSDDFDLERDSAFQNAIVVYKCKPRQPDARLDIILTNFEILATDILAQYIRHSYLKFNVALTATFLKH